MYLLVLFKHDKALSLPPPGSGFVLYTTHESGIHVLSVFPKMINYSFKMSQNQPHNQITFELITLILYSGTGPFYNLYLINLFQRVHFSVQGDYWEELNVYSDYLNRYLHTVDAEKKLETCLFCP